VITGWKSRAHLRNGSKILGDNIAFYKPSHDLLTRNARLARRCLPSLVLAVLLGREGASARENMSRYFGVLLDRRSPCSTDILGIVLQLRACVPPDGFADVQSRTAYDLWLLVPYFKLARAAIDAHNYHAALLCVELSKEYSDPGDMSAFKSQEEKELLYEIYSNLQEPDGFYSISASDLPGGLVRRLHHEGRWLEALSWHGAGLEAAPHMHEGNTAMEKILDCLARGNLGHLAMKLLRADPRASIQVDTLPTLAWKTQNWDIPVPQDAMSQSSYRVYNALMVATGIDQNTGDRHSLLQAISSEIMALTTIDGFSPAADERRLFNILALREVSQWRENPSTCLASYVSEPPAFFESFA
jgi:ataxia telangiectasia mutated family protein